MSEILIIVNPASSGGRTGRRWDAMAGRLKAAGVDFQAVLTTRPNEATEIARAAVLEGRGLVAAAGGDGTLNEVVNGFFDGSERIPSRTGLGLIPLGTGGDFRRTFHLGDDPDLVAAVLSGSQRQTVDVGRATFAGHSGGVQVRHFINIADAGIGGEIVHRVNHGLRVFNGPLTFLTASVLVGLGWKNKPVRLVVDGEVQDLKAQQVIVANCRYFGGGMMVAPTASPDDGWLDLVVVGDLGTLAGAAFLAQVRNGSHLKSGSSIVTHRLVKRVEVSSPEPVRIDLDGEQPGWLTAVFEVV
ncbi:MAG TPA: diacylglycerol kinase family protein, partial [Candidatus Dormibacteraeota bacterium]|nr:diacylglycerol kinase family protein [Candidatus Dormibacteraeota bacterium]